MNIGDILKKKRLDCVVAASPANVTYLSGIVSRDAFVLISKKGNYYITDARYTEEVSKVLKNFKLIIIKNSVFETIASICHTKKLKVLGFEDNYLSFAFYNKLKAGLGKGIRLVPIAGLIEEKRSIKSKKELANIKVAVSIAIKAFKLIKPMLKPGKTELEIAGELERIIRYLGANSSAFDIIVASGPNSSCPHHKTGTRKLKKTDLVLIDMGVDRKGFKSDLTRIFFLGKITSSDKKIYDLVKIAQSQAIKEIKPGVNVSLIDQAARGIIEKAGLGKCFVHSTGHGIGLDVHESPRISSKQTGLLKEGMVLTIEPAIYIPGKFGIRIEDMCLVTKKGAVVLSGTLNK